MPGCCAEGCRNRTEKGFRTFGFPSERQRRRVWEIKVKRPNWTPTKGSRLCEVHFTPDQFKTNNLQRRRLKPLAVPTIFSHSKPVKSRRPPLHRPHGHHEGIFLREVVTREHAYASKEPAPPPAPAQPYGGPVGRAIQILGSIVQLADGSGSTLSFVTVKKEREDPATTEVLEVLPAAEVGLLSAAEEEVSTCDRLTHRMDLELQQRQKVELRRLTSANAWLKTQLQQAKDGALKTKQELKRAQHELRRCRKENRDLQSESSFLTEDQKIFLRKRSMRGHQWAKETLQKALKIRLSVGSAGYKTLLNLNYPLPSLRTLQRDAEVIYKDIVDDWDRRTGDQADQVDAGANVEPAVGDPLLAEGAGVDRGRADGVELQQADAKAEARGADAAGAEATKTAVDNGADEVGKYLTDALGAGNSKGGQKDERQAKSVADQKRADDSAVAKHLKEVLGADSDEDEDDRGHGQGVDEDDEFVLDNLMDGQLAKALGGVESSSDDEL